MEASVNETLDALERSRPLPTPPPLPESIMSQERQESLNVRRLQERAAKAPIAPLSEMQWGDITQRVPEELRQYSAIPLQQRTPHQRR